MRKFSNLKSLNKKKYFTYFCAIIILSVLLWILKKDFLLVISVVVISLVLVMSDFIFDLLGYFKEDEDKKKISISKKIMGYIIGTIIFVGIGSIFYRILLALIDYVSQILNF